MHIKKTLSSFLITMTLFIFNTTQTFFETKKKIDQEMNFLDKKIFELKRQTGMKDSANIAYTSPIDMQKYEEQMNMDAQDLENTMKINHEKYKIHKQKLEEYTHCLDNCINLEQECLKAHYEKNITAHEYIKSTHRFFTTLKKTTDDIYENIDAQIILPEIITKLQEFQKTLTNSIEKSIVFIKTYGTQQKEFNEYYTCLQNLRESPTSSHTCKDLKEKWDNTSTKRTIDGKELLQMNRSTLKASNELDAIINKHNLAVYKLNKNKKAYKKFNETLQRCLRLDDPLCFQVLEKQLLEWNKNA